MNRAAASGLAACVVAAGVVLLGARTGPDFELVLASDARVVDSIDLPGGMTLMRTAHAVVVAPAGSHLSVERTDEMGAHLAVTVPDPGVAPTPGWSVELATRALVHVLAGDGFRAVAAAVGPAAIDPAALILNVACAGTATKTGRITTCTTRQAIGGGDGRYVASATFTLASVDGDRPRNEVRKVMTRDDYPPDVAIVDFAPMRTFRQSGCSKLKLQLVFTEGEVGPTQPVCQGRFDPYLLHAKANGLETTWVGHSAGPTSAPQVETAKVATGAFATLTFAGFATFGTRCSPSILCRLDPFD